MRRSGLLLVVLALAACEKPAPPQTPSAITRFAPPLKAHGNEPFWGLKLDDGRLILSRPDHPDVSVTPRIAHLDPTSAAWEGETPDGRKLRFAVVTIDCSDGMSDRHYMMEAEVRMGEEVLKGCAENSVPPPPAP